MTGERAKPESGSHDLTRAELDHAREVVRVRWPESARRELWELPESERDVAAALCGLLDAAPCDPETGELLVERERPRCVLCGATDFRLRRTPDEEWVCEWRPPCAYRERIALGMPRWVALRKLEADKATEARS